MKLMGFNFTKMSVNKGSQQRPKDLKMNTNLDIEELKAAKADFLKSKDEVIAVHFNYDISYEPKYAKIEFKGILLLGIEPKLAKKVLKEWKKKKLPEEVRLTIFNTILSKSNIKALTLEEEMNLPLHIPMPSLKPSDAKNK